MSREKFIGDVEHQLDGEDYGRGAMEATEHTARNNSRAIGRLLWVLMARGVISEQDAYYAAGLRHSFPRARK